MDKLIDKLRVGIAKRLADTAATHSARAENLRSRMEVQQKSAASYKNNSEFIKSDKGKEKLQKMFEVLREKGVVIDGEMTANEDLTGTWAGQDIEVCISTEARGGLRMHVLETKHWHTLLDVFYGTKLRVRDYRLDRIINQ